MAEQDEANNHQAINNPATHPSSRGLEYWVNFLSNASIPVLKHTSREMLKLQQEEDSVSAREITMMVIPDPMMTLRLLRYSQTHKHKSQLQDMVLVEQAIMMMGMTTFFSKLAPQVLVEDMLKGNITALTRLLKHVHRSHRAARYAAEWAALMYDFHAEEVMVATLLHDLAEMLMWCFAPVEMNRIHDMQAADKALRSSSAQEQVLGFKLQDLQKELVVRWELPPLLARLIHEGASSDRRIRNVTLAVNFARHSANGWDDAALPDDYRDIAELLRVDTVKVMRLVGAPTTE